MVAGRDDGDGGGGVGISDAEGHRQIERFFPVAAVDVGIGRHIDGLAPGYGNPAFSGHPHGGDEKQVDYEKNRGDGQPLCLFHRHVCLPFFNHVKKAGTLPFGIMFDSNQGVCQGEILCCGQFDVVAGAGGYVNRKPEFFHEHGVVRCLDAHLPCFLVGF